MTESTVRQQAGDDDAGKETESLTSSMRWALAGLSLSMLMASLDTSIANVGLPAISGALGGSFRQAQWVVLAYLLAITTLIVSAGRLGDLLGRRRVLLAGIGLFTLASAACGLAPTLGLLIVARAVQGLGAALMMALTIALAGEAVPKARTGRAMGLLGTMSALGTTLGPSLGGVIIASFGWRLIFLINVPLGIVNVALALRGLPPDRAEAKAPPAGFDAAGTALLALTLAALALATTTGRGALGPFNLPLLAAGAGGAALFVLAESRSSSPLIRLAMFRNATLSAGLVMSVLVSAVMMATLVVGPFYLSRALGLDAARVGLATSAGPLVAALAGIPAGRLVDRLGCEPMTTAGLAGMGAGLAALCLAPARFGVAGYVIPLVVVTAHYALFQAANNTAIMADVRADQRGVVSGMLSLSRNLGLITGASALGAVFALASATTDIATMQPLAAAAGMRATFTVAALLIAAALAVAPAGRALSARGLTVASRHR